MTKEFVANINLQSREDTRSFLTEFVKRLDFKNEKHRFLYDQIMIRIFGKNSLGFSHTLEDQVLDFTRVRKCCCKGTLFNNLCELIYPPAKITKIGRANLDSETVFYCSNDPGTSIFEVRPKLGDWIATTTFRNYNKTLKSVVLGTDTYKLKEFNNLPPYLQGLHDFLNDIFVEEIKEGQKHNYYKTASICKSIIGNTNSILYPSVASNLKGWNYVFSVNEFNESFKFVDSRIQEVTEYKSPYEFKVKCLYLANSIDKFKDLKWEKQTPECKGHNIDNMIYE
jgi:hypothetical protein